MKTNTVLLVAALAVIGVGAYILIKKQSTQKPATPPKKSDGSVGGVLGSVSGALDKLGNLF